MPSASQPRHSTSTIWVWRCLCLRYFLNYALSQPAQAQHLKNPGVEMLEPSSFLVYALKRFFTRIKLVYIGNNASDNLCCLVINS